MISYIKENLPRLSEQMLGYRQTPLTSSIGLDFAVSRGQK
jgi:hypothetical protein